MHTQAQIRVEAITQCALLILQRLVAELSAGHFKSSANYDVMTT